MNEKKSVVLPYGKPCFFSTEENMLADAAMRGICAQAPDVLIHKNITCSFCRMETVPEKRFSISIADPWCEGWASKITVSEKLVFKKETYQSLNVSIMEIVKGFLNTNAYVIVNGMIFDDTGHKEEKKCMIVGYDDVNTVLTLLYRGNTLELRRLELPYDDCDHFFFQTSEDEILFLTWSNNPESLYDAPSVPRLLFELSDYMNSRNKRFQYTAGFEYGFRAMELLCEDLYSLMSRGKNIPLAYMSQYSYHKYKMVGTIRRLCGCEMLSQAFLSVANELERLAAVFDQSVEAYQKSKSNEKSQAVLCCIKNVEKLEKEFIPKVHSHLASL